MEFSKEKWKKLHRECGNDPYQSFEWSEVNKTAGFKPHFLFIENEQGDYTAGMLYFEMPQPVRFTRKKVLFCEGIPLYKEEKSLGQIISKFKEKVKQEMYGSIRPLRAYKCLIQFSNPDMKTKAEHTILIYLKKTMDILWQEAEKKTARWGVKKAEKEGVTVELLANGEELKGFYDAYQETAESGDFQALSYEFFERFYELMHEKQGYLLVAKKENKVIAGAMLLSSDNYIRLRIQGTLRDYMEYQPSSALYWGMIKLAKEKGFEYIDLGGYGKYAAKDSKSAKVSRFKTHFGGEVVECPIYYCGTLYVYLKKIMDYIKK